MKTTDTLLVFTSFGNYLYIPVHTINDLKWRELGKHVSNLVPLQEDEEIVTALPVSDFNDKKNIILATSQGMIKSTSLADFKLTRYSKATSCMKLKDNDRLIAAFYDTKDEIFIETSKGYGLWFSKEEIPVVGIKAGGVKAITLKDDSVTSILNFNESDNKYLAIVTDKGTGKRMHLKDFDKTTRARRGLLTIRDVKTNPYHVVAAFFLSPKEEIGLKNGEITYYKGSDLTIADRYSTGSTLRKGGVDTAFKVVELNDINNQEEEIEVLEVEDIIDIDDNNIVRKERNSAKEKEKELLEQVVNLLRIKNDTLTITKMNKKWLTKYQYVYKLAQILSIGDTKELVDTIMHPTFKEIYDYDLERTGLYENLRNKIYEMPIYVFLRILTYAILYNDPTFFDGVYKILKYKVQIDSENHFKEIKKNDSYAKKQLRSLISFMQKISIKFDNKKVFELDRIERYVKLKNYVNH